MLNRKHNLKSGKSKDKKKELERKKGRKLKKRNDFRKENLQFNSLMLFLS